MVTKQELIEGKYNTSKYVYHATYCDRETIKSEGLTPAVSNSEWADLNIILDTVREEYSYTGPEKRGECVFSYVSVNDILSHINDGKLICIIDVSSASGRGYLSSYNLATQIQELLDKRKLTTPEEILDLTAIDKDSKEIHDLAKQYWEKCEIIDFPVGSIDWSGGELCFEQQLSSEIVGFYKQQ